MADGNAKALGQLAEAELWLSPLDPAHFAPDFSVTDLEGKRVRLSSFRGRTVALFFLGAVDYNTNFEYMLLGYAQKLQHSAAGRQGRLVVLLATPIPRETIRPIVQEHGYTFRVLCDPDDTIRTALGLYATPAVLIDPEGRLVWQRRLWEQSKVEDSGLFLAVKHVLAGNLTFRPVSWATKSPTDSEQVLFNFENGFGGWKLTGDCWGNKPATDALYPGLVKGYVGHSFLSSFGPRGFRATGIASSPDFVVTKPFLHFLVGGGDLPDHCAVALVCGGLTVRLATGRNTAELEPALWDMRNLMGKTVHLEVYDGGTTEPRDFIMLDQVVASDNYGQPASFAKRFDPDNPKYAAEAADSTPTDYKRLQAGEFHEKAVPGPTYRLERTGTVRWPDRPTDWLEFSYIPPPTHFAQTLRSFGMTIEADGKSYQARPVLTGRLFMPWTYVCYIPANQVPDRRGTIKINCEITPNRLPLVKGSTKEAPPSADLCRILTSTFHCNYTNLWVRQFITQNELWRWPRETDAHYLLRAFRFFQRNFSSVSRFDPWGGWPSSKPWPLNMLEERAGSCQLAEPMVMLLSANEISASYEAGVWLGDNGGSGPAHAKALVYIGKVGWLWFGVSPEVRSPCYPFELPRRHNDNHNFMDEVLTDIPAEYRIPTPAGSKRVLYGRLKWDPSWAWRSRIVTPPSAKSN